MSWVYHNFSGRTIRILTPGDLEVESFARTAKRLSNFGKDSNGSYVCRNCGGFIKGAPVLHLIWGDDALPILARTAMAGKRDIIETVLFCPNCQEKPALLGDPIIVTRICFKYVLNRYSLN